MHIPELAWKFKKKADLLDRDKNVTKEFKIILYLPKS